MRWDFITAKVDKNIEKRGLSQEKCALLIRHDEGCSVFAARSAVEKRTADGCDEDAPIYIKRCVDYCRTGLFLGNKSLPSLVIIEDADFRNSPLLNVNYFLILRIMPNLGF